MFKKQLLVLGLLSLVIVGLFAQTDITLSSPRGQQTSVVLIFVWDHTNTIGGGYHNLSYGYYKVQLSKNSDMSGTLIEFEPATCAGTFSNPTPGNNVAYIADYSELLDYDTTYYWRVRQYISGTDVELDNPSGIESFRTPRQSVAPYIRWNALAGTDPEYVITFTEVGTTPPVVITYNTGSLDTYYKVNPATDNLLRYNTEYTWTVSRDSYESAPVAYRTKPLNIIEEKVAYYNGTTYVPTTPYMQIIASGTRLFYAALTDEFDDLDGGIINATFTARGSISDPLRDSLVGLTFQQLGMPDTEGILTTSPTGRSAIEMEFSLIPWAGTENWVTASEIPLTSNETLTLKFEYGNEFFYRSGMNGGSIEGITMYTESTYTTAAASNTDTEIYISFDADGADIGATKKIHIDVLDYAVEKTFERQAYAISSTQYRYHITTADFDLLYSTAPVINNNRPIRISVYPVDHPTVKQDIIWRGKAAGYITAATDVVWGAADYPIYHPTIRPQIISSVGGNYTRVVSNIDSVGMIVIINPNPIYLGVTTVPITRTIAAGFTLGTGTVSAVSFDWVGSETVISYFNVTAQQYDPFSMVMPSDFSTNVDVYPRLEWTQGFEPEPRNETFRTHYLVTIANNPYFTDTAVGDTVYYYKTTETFLYPPFDLQFSTSYFWRVDIVPGGANSSANNLGDQGGWTFTTVRPQDYFINEPIITNRVLTSRGPYNFTNNPTVAAGGSLTILGPAQINVDPGATFMVYGDLIVGTDSTVTIAPEDSLATWNGILLSANNSNLVVDAGHNYVSGPYLSVHIKQAENPIAFGNNVTYDIYIENSYFTDNVNGVYLSPGSYLRNVEFYDFREPAAEYVISGGKYFDDLKIDGTVYDFPDSSNVLNGIITTSPDAIFTKNVITDVLGNAIHINTTAAGTPLIVENTIYNTGTDQNSVAILAKQDAIISNNTITGNTGYAIQNGAYITQNDITGNGNGAIRADLNNNAVVLENIITNNYGYGIQNGGTIQFNEIINTTTSIDSTSTNAITADATANVSNNTITNTEGYGILGGQTIFNNIIERNAQPLTAFTITADYFAIKATAGVDAVINSNTITNPVGFGIENGTEIRDNTITGGTYTDADNAFGIKAEVGAVVTGNTITDMTGTGIENGSYIQNNYIYNGTHGILADDDAEVLSNVLTKSGNLAGVAIHGGKFINYNQIDGFETQVPTRVMNSVYDLISSATVEEFQYNVITNNVANGGSIVFAEKDAGVTTPLIFRNNYFENNTYNKNAVRIASHNLQILDNVFVSDFDPSDVTTIGGLLSIDNLADGEGTVFYIELRDPNARMQRNEITKHKGAVKGAALYITGELPNKIVIDDKNIFSDNHAIGQNSRGAAVYHDGGIVILGSEIPMNPFGNTITYNSVQSDLNVTTTNVSVSVDQPSLLAGSAIHIESGEMHILRNIIAANRGNYAISGNPEKLNGNNIYDNYITQTIAVPDITQWELNQHFHYTETGTFTGGRGANNFWGTRSDLVTIDPSIWDDNEDVALGAVHYQPILVGPSPDTPGIVGSIKEIRTTRDIPVWSGPNTLDQAPVLRIPLDQEVYIVITAEDNNDFSRDFTEAIIRNMATGNFIKPLLWETDQAEEIYIAKFMLTTNPAGYNPEKNILPATGGDPIRIESVTDPSQFRSLMAAIEGSTTVHPYVLEYDFRMWEKAGSANSGAGYISRGDEPYGDPQDVHLYRPSKTFTFTNNSANNGYMIKSITIDPDTVYFRIIQAPADSTIIYGLHSYDIVIEYVPDNAILGIHNANLVVEVFVPGETADISNWTIALTAETIDAWTDNHVEEPWGPPAVLGNQMTIVGFVTIDGRYANNGDILTAWTVTGMKEVLRGKAQIENNMGLVTIVINTETEDEEIYFKVWDAANKAMYEVPANVNIQTEPGSTIRAPHQFPAQHKVWLMGTTWDANSPTDPVPNVSVSNKHGYAEINSTTAMPYKYITDADGNYFMTVWRNEHLILYPEKDGYSFTVTNPGTQPQIGAPTRTDLRSNDQIFELAGGIILSPDEVYYNSTYFSNTRDTQVDTNKGHDLINGNYVGTWPDVDWNVESSLTAWRLEGEYEILDWNGTIATFLVGGTLHYYKDPLFTNTDHGNSIPLANVTLEVNWSWGDTTTTSVRYVETDDKGQFYFLVDSGTTITSIDITMDNLSAAGYSHIQPAGFRATNGATNKIELTNNGFPWVIKSHTLDIDVDPSKFERTLEILLHPGWNILSLNVEMTPNRPEIVFSQNNLDPAGPFITEIRNLTVAYSIGGAGSNLLDAILPNEGYHVFNNSGGDVTLKVTGKPAEVKPIDLLMNNWNLVGYTVPKPAQTRTIIENDTEIVQMVNETEAYFFTDDPVGSSTLKMMSPGVGYWVKTDSTNFVDSLMVYQFPAYNNQIKRISHLRTTPSLSHLPAKFDNDYLGLPMTADTTLTLVKGNTYKVITTDIELTSYGARGEVGEIFTATDDAVLSVAQVMDIRGPKRIDMIIDNGGTGPLTADILLVEDQPFTIELAKLYTKAQYDAIVNLWTAPGVGGLTAGWDAILHLINTSGVSFLNASNDLNSVIGLTVGVSDPSYIIFASQDLSPYTFETDPPVDRDQAQIVVYQVTITPADDTDNELLEVALIHNPGSTEKRYQGIKTGDNEFTIAVEDTFMTINYTGSEVLEFAISGKGLYNGPQGLLVPSTQLTSRAVTVLQEEIYTYNFWVADAIGAWDTASPAGEKHFKVHVVQLPPPVNHAIIRNAPEPLFARNSFRGAPSNIPNINFGDPFGIPRFQTNSHLVFTRIVNQNNGPINTSFVMAAYVNGELRGKSRVINFNGSTYAPILVHTTTTGQPITFKLWRDGYGIFEEITATQLTTIPGGTTGSLQQPYLLRLDNFIVDEEDIVDPLYVTEMRGAYPNPFNPSTTIAFSLKDRQHTNISIYNIKGQRVARLVNETLDKGLHSVVWNGENSAGNKVGSGVYFIRMNTNDYNKVQKVLLLK